MKWSKYSERLQGHRSTNKRYNIRRLRDTDRWQGVRLSDNSFVGSYPAEHLTKKEAQRACDVEDEKWVQEFDNDVNDIVAFLQVHNRHREVRFVQQLARMSGMY